MKTPLRRGFSCAYHTATGTMRDNADMNTDTARHDTVTKSLLDTLLDKLEQQKGREIHAGELLEAMGHRGFGFAYVLFGILAAALPTGLCSLMALPIILFALQQLFGRARPSLPARFDNKRYSADALHAGIQRRRNWLVQLERFAKPRWKIMTHDIVYRFAALCCLVLALVILVPGPFTNIPPGVAIALFGFAMVERDGLLMLISFIAGVIGFIVGLSAVIATALLIGRWIAQSSGLPG
jgi:hypothetical protein